jgi:hypothetical protein
MSRIVGRRLSSEPQDLLKVVVYRRWPWQKDVFVNEGDIGVSITGGTLMVTMPDDIVSYAPRHWRRVTSKQIHPHPHP